MTTSDMVIQLCEKLKRNTVNLDELIAIADAFGVTFGQSFTLLDGEKIRICNLYTNRNSGQ